MAEFTTLPAEPSMGDIRAMFSSDKTEAPASREPEAPAEGSEPTAEEKQPEVKTESAPAGEKQQQPESIEEKEPELDPGVQKRIAKEVAQTLEIRKAISERKAAQAELEKLTTKSGSQPAQTSEVVAKPEPTPPDADKFETFGELEAAKSKYQQEWREWMLDKTTRETRQAIEREFQERQAKQGRDEFLANGVKTHGAEFKDHVAALETAMPANLQYALSSVKDVGAMVVHLAKNPSELTALTDQFKENPFAAVLELGRIEQRLNGAAKQPLEGEAEGTEPEKKLLPNPPRKVGGNASAHNGAVDYEKDAWSTVKGELRRLSKKAG